MILSSENVLQAFSTATHIAVLMSCLCSSPSLLASRKRPLTARAALACDELSWIMASDREDRIAALRERVTLFLQIHSGNTSITVQTHGVGGCGVVFSVYMTNCTTFMQQMKQTG